MMLATRIAQQPDETYRAWRPSLPGCSVCGQTREEAHSRIDMAVQGYLAHFGACLPRELSRTMEMA